MKSWSKAIWRARRLFYIPDKTSRHPIRRIRLSSKGELAGMVPNEMVRRFEIDRNTEQS